MTQPSLLKTALLPLGALFLSLAAVVSGQGMLNTLVPLHLAANADAGFVSLVGTTYFAGFTAGAWYGGRVIRRVGHVRAFAGLAATMVMMALLLPLVPQTGWVLVRFVHGASIAGVVVAIEAWLSGVAPSMWRGQVLAWYALASNFSYGSGQFLLTSYDAGDVRLFVLGGLLLALGIVPMALSRMKEPVVAAPTNVSFGYLLGLSPIGLAGAATAGMTNGAFVALMPMFGERMGMGAAGVGWVMAAAVFGGLLLQWPLGMLSDRMDRRIAVMISAAIGLAASLGMAVVPVGLLWALLAVAALFGGVVFGLYPLALALAADRLSEGEDMVPMSSSMLLVFGLGASLGPVVAGVVFPLLANRGLFVYTGGAFLLLVAAAILRQRMHPAPEVGPRTEFVPMPGYATRVVMELDPRVEPEQPELDFSAPPPGGDEPEPAKAAE